MLLLYVRIELLYSHTSGNIHTTKRERKVHTMEMKFETSNRKALVTAISEILGVKPKYLGMPSAAYRVNWPTEEGEIPVGNEKTFLVDRVGTIIFDEEVNHKDVEMLQEQLAERGFLSLAIPEELAESELKTEVEEEQDQSQTMGLQIEMPKEYITEGSLENLKNLVQSKASLVKKSLGIEHLEIKVDDEKVKFPWFEVTPEDEDTVAAYTHFIYALCETARKQKRVQGKEKPSDNEKYTFRCFLLKLGFIGAEYKKERKILLQNFSGSSAFKGKKYRVELDEDKFKIFTADTKKQAQEIAEKIAAELGSDFCELHEEEL